MTTPMTAPAQALMAKSSGERPVRSAARAAREVDAGVELVEHPDAEFGGVHDQALALDSSSTRPRTA